jgi:hypothetical protein
MAPSTSSQKGDNMKIQILAVALGFVSISAFAHPGGHTLICQSAPNSGSSQQIRLELTRSNSAGWYAPKATLDVNQQKFTLDTPDETKNYGETYHNSPLGVITVTIDNFSEDVGHNFGRFSVVAIPQSVQAFDTEGKPVNWSLKDEKDDCFDSSGSATFQGIFHGILRSNEKGIDLDTQILDCTLKYDSGMAC